MSAPENPEKGEGAGSPRFGRLARLISHRVESKGLRPRLAAGLIASAWLFGIVVFGIVIRLVDPGSFDSIWSGMWWATQTVTTVGYGDVVPEQPFGQFIAALLMLGGLSFFAVITATITSGFVARAQARLGGAGQAETRRELERVSAQLEQIRAEIATLRDTPPAEGSPPR